MMTRETDVLADAVMNALWFSDWYRPTKGNSKEQPADELNPGKLARESVVLPLLRVKLTDTKFCAAASGLAASLTLVLGRKRVSKKRLSFSSKLLTYKPMPATTGPSLISSLILTSEGIPLVGPLKHVTHGVIGPYLSSPGCKPCWALIEYALDIDLPDFVVEDPLIQALNQGTNDLVTWSNVS